MTTSPKLHHKLNGSKNITVSVDSLLGVLSSAYGTEELDSNTLFQSNTVKWRNISVEQLSTQRKNEGLEAEAQCKLIYNDMKKINVSTSTSNLKLERSSENKIDLTLVSIKSLENLKQSINRPSITDHEHSISITSSPLLDGTYKQQLLTEIPPGENTSQQLLTEIPPGENTSSLSFPEGDCINCRSDIEVNYDHLTTACGFCVNGSNQEMLFDIKFCNKITNNYLPKFATDEQDVLINVADLVKQTKSHFAVPISCMVSKCQVFAEVEKEFGLVNLEVYVKCNLNIFNWIIQWVKADIPLCKPKVVVNNVKDILSIAYHLRIHTLIDECLDICFHDLRSVLEADYSIEHIFGEDLMLKLVKRFCNSNVNQISDEFNSFKMKMFCGLIRLLADQDMYFEVGHYSTLATIFQCGSCKKLLNQNIMSSVPCTSDRSQVDFKGMLNYYHDVSPSWNLSKYIELIFEVLQNWMEVYWYLWGVSHFLYCIECQVPYPVSQSEWCPYHSESVEYFPLNSNLHYPTGTYSCCGGKAFKFNVLQPYSGCNFKSHTPDLSLIENRTVHLIYEANKHLISCNPPEITTKTFVKLVKQSEYTVLGKEEVVEQLWWDGLLLAPKQKKDYSIISTDILNLLRNRTFPKKITPNQKPLIFEAQVHFGVMPSHIKGFEENLDSVHRFCSGQGKMDKPKLSESSAKFTSGPIIKNKIKKKKCSSIYLQPSESAVWSSSQSNKTNQDNQRDFEELAMKRLVKILSLSSPDPTPEPTAGTYIRLEAEWWDDHCAITGNNTKHSSTVVNRTFPLSWFRRVNL